MQLILPIEVGRIFKPAEPDVTKHRGEFCHPMARRRKQLESQQIPIGTRAGRISRWHRYADIQVSRQRWVAIIA